MPREVECEGLSCYMNLFKNLLHFFFISAENVGVVPWCVFWWFVWFYIHWTYNWVFRRIFKKTSIQEEKYLRLIKLYWNVAFASLSVPFALGNLQLDYIDLSDRFYYVLENHISRWFALPSLPLQTKMSYVILSGFYLNNICEICCEFGPYSKEFLLNESLGLFFIATYPLRCVPFGLATVVLVNIVNCFMALSQVFICLGDIAQSFYLQVVISRLFFVIHAILWLFIYFHLLPMHFMRALFNKVDAKNDAKQASMFFLLNCAFVAYYLLYLIFCPMSKTILNFILRLRSPLASDEVPPEGESESFIEENERNRDIRKKENLRMLYHTIKCMIRMRRKLAKMRELRARSSVVSNVQDEEGENELNVSLENLNEDDNSLREDGVNGLGSESQSLDTETSWNDIEKLKALNVGSISDHDDFVDEDDAEIYDENSEETALDILS